MTTDTAFQTIDRSLIDTADNVRATMGKEGIAELARSIDSVGLQTPLLVKDLHNGRYELIAGHRRLAAVELLGVDRVSVHVAEPMSDAQRTVAQLVENLQREDLDILDEARGYASLIGWQMNQDTIAKTVGKNKGHVSKRLKLLQLPPKAQDLLTKGELTIEHALELADVAGADPELVVRAITTGGARPVERLRTLVEEKKVRDKVTKAIGIAERAGVPVIKDFDVREKPSWVLVGTYGGYALRGIQVDEKAHRKEPCRALLVIGSEERPVIKECCSDPKRHGTKGESKLKVPEHGTNAVFTANSTDPTISDEDRAKAKAKLNAEKEAAAATAKARAEATERREAFLVSKIKARQPKSVLPFIVRQAADWLLENLVDEEDVGGLAALAGVEAGDDGTYDSGAISDRLAELMDKSDADTLRVATFLLLQDQHVALNHAGWRMRQAGFVDDDGKPKTNALVTVFTEWGYEFGPQEKIDLGLAKPKRERKPRAKPEKPVEPEVEAITEPDPGEVEIEDETDIPEQLQDNYDDENPTEADLEAQDEYENEQAIAESIAG